MDFYFCQNQMGIALHWTIDIAANIQALYDDLFYVQVVGGTVCHCHSITVCKVDGRVHVQL